MESVAVYFNRDTRNAISNLESAVPMMEDDYPFAGHPELITQAAGTLELLRFSTIHEVNRWTDYARARGRN